LKALLKLVRVRPRGGKTTTALGTAGLWQIANYAIPLLTFPYLARILGPTGFGILGIGTAIITYAAILTDWGFAYTATQSASRLRGDPVALNQLVWATIAAKLMFFVSSSLLVAGGAALFVADPVLRVVLWLSLLTLVGNVFNLDWLLRGTELFGRFATTSVIGRLFAVPLVYLLVHTPSDVPAAAFAIAISAPITALLTFHVSVRAGLVSAPVFDFRAMRHGIRDGMHLFVSTAMISLYTNSLLVILGFTGGLQQTGMFSGADKVRRPVQSLYTPLSMVFFPRINHLTETDPEEARRLSLKVLRIQGTLALVLALGLCIAAPLAVRILLGSSFEGAVSTLRILSWVIFLVGLSNVLGLMIMLPFGLKSAFSRCVSLGAVVGFGLAVPLSWMFGAEGAASAAVVAEITVTSAMFFVLWRRFEWFRQGVFSFSWG